MRAIKVMPDYHCHPLWEDSVGVYGDIDPSELPISTELREQLEAWADLYEQGLDMKDPRSSIGMTAEENDRFHEQGRALTMKLQQELGSSYAVRYWK